jgi:hypothetical protein
LPGVVSLVGGVINEVSGSVFRTPSTGSMRCRFDGVGSISGSGRAESDWGRFSCGTMRVAELGGVAADRGCFRAGI